MSVAPHHILKHIRLELARSKEFPAGSPRHGYDIVAPLDHNGHIDLELWRKYRESCRVRRFWGDEEDAVGHLVHKPGGSEHARWAFEYDNAPDYDADAGFRFGAHVFSPGEYVSISDGDGVLHTFAVASVEPVEQ